MPMSVGSRAGPRSRHRRAAKRASSRKAGTGSRAGSRSQGPQQQRRETRRDRPKAPPPLLARQGRELLYGRNAVREALRGRRKLDRLFIAEGVREDNRLQPIVALARERGVAIDRVPRELLDDATHGANHQGVALEAETYAYAPFENLIETPVRCSCSIMCRTRRIWARSCVRPRPPAWRGW